MKKNIKNTFKTPNDYFGSFNKRLINRIGQEESLIPKNDGFKVSEVYFEDVFNKVSRKIQEEQPKVIRLKSYKKYYYAASIAAILLVGFWFNQNNQEKVDFDDLAAAELDAYFELTELNLNSYELAEVIDFENISILDITETDDTLEKELILDYLDDNLDSIENLDIDDELE